MTTPQRNQTPRTTPSQTPGKTPAKQQCSNKGCIYKLVAIFASLILLAGLGGYFIYSRAGKRGITYYGIAVTVAILTYFVLTKVLGKKKTD